MNFINDEKSESENLNVADQSGEWLLFRQINEDNKNEINFELNDSNNVNEVSQTIDSANDKPLFMKEENESIDDSEAGNGEITFDLPDISDNVGGQQILDIEAPEQKQPELWDLLLNSPIDLSKELNDTAENLESDSWDMGASSDLVTAWGEVNSGNSTFEPIPEDVISEQAAEEHISEPVVEETISENPLQEVEVKSDEWIENYEISSDTPQIESKNQNVEENLQPEIAENNVESESYEQSQSDERSEIINSAVSEINGLSTETPEINITTPVELSDVSSNQREVVLAESEGQVQSTLSLDQILDSELLSNPQYAENSKVSSQNTTASSGSSKKSLLIGVGVAALACCVAVLAFPSISGDRKPWDTVTTWTFVEYPVFEDPHPSAPTGLEKPDMPDEDLKITDYSDFSSVSWGWWQVVNFPDEGDDSWDGDETGEPIPYVWTDDWQSDNQVTEEPIIEEVDKNQILDVILSFKTQAETYYSLGEQNADKQLMKYSLRLITVCDNYREKVNNGEWVDSESFSSFKSSANKIISKIDTYLGGDEDVPVIREATIDGETNFEWKDEIKEYLYNNR